MQNILIDVLDSIFLKETKAGKYFLKFDVSLVCVKPEETGRYKSIILTKNKNNVKRVFPDIIKARQHTIKNYLEHFEENYYISDDEIETYHLKSDHEGLMSLFINKIQINSKKVIVPATICIVDEKIDKNFENISFPGLAVFFHEMGHVWLQKKYIESLLKSKEVSGISHTTLKKFLLQKELEITNCHTEREAWFWGLLFLKDAFKLKSFSNKYKKTQTELINTFLDVCRRSLNEYYVSAACFF